MQLGAFESVTSKSFRIRPSRDALPEFRASDFVIPSRLLVCLLKPRLRTEIADAYIISTIP
jgi:hypothetical protein